jgi:hypothetical protein
LLFANFYSDFDLNKITPSQANAANFEKCKALILEYSSIPDLIEETKETKVSKAIFVEKASIDLSQTSINKQVFTSLTVAFTK